MWCLKGSDFIPIIVERFLIAELVSAEKISDIEYSGWKWREEFLGFQSTLTIYESTQKFKGKRFIVFNNFFGNCLSTGYGEYTIIDDELVMVTKNSIYKFKIIYQGDDYATKIINQRQCFQAYR